MRLVLGGDHDDQSAEVADRLDRGTRSGHRLGRGDAQGPEQFSVSPCSAVDVSGGEPPGQQGLKRRAEMVDDPLHVDAGANLTLECRHGRFDPASRVDKRHVQVETLHQPVNFTACDDARI